MKIDLVAPGAGRSAFADDLRTFGEADVGAARAFDWAERAGDLGLEGPGFAAVLEKTATAASAKKREAVAKAEALADGRIDDLHGTMITMKEAEISMKLVGSVRDKLLDAFHELWRINV